MTKPTGYSAPPVDLPSRQEPDPDPVEECAGCSELAAVRDRARAGGDMTTVTDCNVHLRRHPEGHQ
ncbi:hypothetical protein V1460_08125 [Streptomyces sp. SCSIO 30461]|uniref:hypothetical protein n=1 Tax=Streptomyces sp. SCSIO 30461 TaxID=3118085 RepID=UPI0030D130CB